MAVDRKIKFRSGGYGKRRGVGGEVAGVDGGYQGVRALGATLRRHCGDGAGPRLRPAQRVA